MVNPLSYFSFQPVPHEWYNKGCGMCCPVSGVVYYKDPLLIIEQVAHVVAAAGFALSLSEWSFTICMMPYK